MCKEETIILENKISKPASVHRCELRHLGVELGLPGERYGEIEGLSPFGIETAAHHQIRVITLR